MLDLGGLFYWWRKAIEEPTPLVVESLPCQLPHNLIQNSPCYRAKNVQAYGVKIELPWDDGVCFMYPIIQNLGSDKQESFERVGSIQIMNKTDDIWVRWGLIPHCIRQFNVDELGKLLQVLEKTHAKLAADCLHEFSQKNTLNDFYQNRV